MMKRLFVMAANRLRSWFIPPDGPCERFHDNGQLELKGHYKDGREEGPWEFYYDNGQF